MVSKQSSIYYIYYILHIISFFYVCIDDGKIFIDSLCLLPPVCCFEPQTADLSKPRRRRRQRGGYELNEWCSNNIEGFCY